MWWSAVDLMVMKRVRPQTNSRDDPGDGVISRLAAGLCFDFPVDSGSLYFAGTEDGMLYTCSVSYNEQYLQTVQAHNGPINRVRCSKFLSHAVLTASADWSVKLWNMAMPDDAAPATYQALHAADAVTDVAWSPHHATQFASVTGDGRVLLWDIRSLTPIIEMQLEHSGDDAVAAHERREQLSKALEKQPGDAVDGDGGAASGNHNPQDTGDVEYDWMGKKKKRDAAAAEAEAAAAAEVARRASQPVPKRLSCVAFADNAPVIVLGDDCGNVDVYRLTGLPEAPNTIDGQVEMLDKAIMEQTTSK